jgi:hypothetical protein
MSNDSHYFFHGEKAFLSRGKYDFLNDIRRIVMTLPPPQASQSPNTYNTKYMSDDSVLPRFDKWFIYYIN